MQWKQNHTCTEPDSNRVSEVTTALEGIDVLQPTLPYIEPFET